MSHPTSRPMLDSISGSAEEHALYEALVASLSDIGEGLMIIENRRFTFVNDALAEMTGYRKAEMMAWPTFLMLFGLEEQPHILDNHLRRLSGEEFKSCYETRLQHRRGHAVEVEMAVALLSTPERRGVVITVRDIRQRKQAEAEIRNKNQALQLLAENLEQKVKERTQELERANHELRRLNKVKSEFLAVVSHELRTPLTSIKSFTEILLEDMAEQDPQTCQRYLSIIATETDRLNRLIGDLLDLQKIDAGRLEWNDNRLNMVEVAKHVVELFAPAYRSKGLTLSLHTDEDPVWLYAERDRLEQVLGNLLGNALKFTERGGAYVALSRSDTTEDGITEPEMILTVTDTGIGIDAANQPHIFERFYQADSPQHRLREGAGLGLSIVREIITHYGGRIRVRSHPNEGSAFEIRWPLVRAE